MTPRLFFVIALASLQPLAAQSTFGSVVGNVRDSSGAAVPGALMTLHNVDENTSRTATSNDAGLYEVLNLKPSRYEVIATKSGFSTFKVAAFLLDARQTIRADIRLEVATLTETVIVADTAAVLNTQNGTIGDSKNFQQVTELPGNFHSRTTSPLAVFVAVPGVQQHQNGGVSIGGGTSRQTGNTP